MGPGTVAGRLSRGSRNFRANRRAFDPGPYGWAALVGVGAVCLFYGGNKARKAAHDWGGALREFKNALSGKDEVPAAKAP
jgi:Sec-independent protein translocase protein TatA